MPEKITLCLQHKATAQTTLQSIGVSPTYWPPTTTISSNLVKTYILAEQK